LLNVLPLMTMTVTETNPNKGKATMQIATIISTRVKPFDCTTRKPSSFCPYSLH
jgi:hypothetical protein